LPAKSENTLVSTEYRGLSCLRGNYHEQFLGEGSMATYFSYPTISDRMEIGVMKKR
jgi:hypothetical protein